MSNKKKKPAPKPQSPMQPDYDSDVLGSYTGVPLDGEMPVQDADDL